MAVIGTRLYATGGAGESSRFDEAQHTCESVDTTGQSEWTSAADMSVGRYDHVAAASSQHIVVCGAGADESAAQSCELYDGTRWRRIADLPAASLPHDPVYAAFVTADDAILVADGRATGGHVYDVASDTWSPSGALQREGEGGATAAISRSERVVSHRYGASVITLGLSDLRTASLPALPHEWAAVRAKDDGIYHMAFGQ